MLPGQTQRAREPLHEGGCATVALRTALEEVRRYDLPGTPSILVNGVLAPDPPAFLPPFEFFKRLVEEELARQARAAR